MPNAPTASEKRHFARLAKMECIACGAWDVELHHVTSDGHQRLSKRHDRVVPLCAAGCHRLGPQAVHVIGHAAFNELHGFDLLEIADGLWRESNG